MIDLIRCGGENAHQQAAAYRDALGSEYSVLSADILHGKQLSYNNIRDADAALRIIAEFAAPTVVTVAYESGWYWSGEQRLRRRGMRPLRLMISPFSGHRGFES